MSDLDSELRFGNPLVAAHHRWLGVCDKFSFWTSLQHRHKPIRILNTIWFSYVGLSAHSASGYYHFDTISSEFAASSLPPAVVHGSLRARLKPIISKEEKRRNFPSVCVFVRNSHFSLIARTWTHKSPMRASCLRSHVPSSKGGKVVHCVWYISHMHRHTPPNECIYCTRETGVRRTRDVACLLLMSFDGCLYSCTSDGSPHTHALTHLLPLNLVCFSPRATFKRPDVNITAIHIALQHKWMCCWVGNANSKWCNAFKLIVPLKTTAKLPNRAEQPHGQW